MHTFENITRLTLGEPNILQAQHIERDIRNLLLVVDASLRKDLQQSLIYVPEKYPGEDDRIVRIDWSSGK